MASADVFHPLTFRLQAGERRTFSGVKDFTAQEGEVKIPEWISRSLKLDKGDMVFVRLEELPKGEKVVLFLLGEHQPNDWRSLLESQLRSFTTLTKGEIIEIPCSTGTLQVLIKSLQPEDAVTITDTDLETELEYSVPNSVAKDEVLNMQLDQRFRLIVDKNQYRNFKLDSWDGEKSLFWTLDVEEGDADILISTAPCPTFDNYIWSTFTGPIEIKPAVNFAKSLHLSIYGFQKSTFIISVTQHPPQVDSIEGKIQCGNCKAWVPSNSMLLHSNFCSRNNVLCKCGDIVKRSEMANHWHCNVCDGHGMGSFSKEKHDWIFHVPRKCVCSVEFASLPQLSQHKQTECPERTIVCRYCHLLVPQGELSTLPQHALLLLSLTPHEVACGSRTTNCSICNKLVTLSDLDVHTKLHVLSRKSASKCRNSNCYRDRVDNCLKLCAVCFGPLWSPVLDSDGTKLKSRVERRLVLQLVNGCGRKYCRNSFCATALGSPLQLKEAHELTNPIIQNVWDETTDLPFCVDEATRRKMEILKESGL